MSEIRTCTVAYQDIEGVKHSVDVTAESLYEAAALGVSPAARTPGEGARDHHTISNAVLAAWPSRNGRTPKGWAVKTRLRDLLRN